jgi:TolA-binding protein
MSRARITAVVLALAVACAGCAGIEWRLPSLVWPDRTPPHASTPAVVRPTVPVALRGSLGRLAEPVLLVNRADEFARDGMPFAARDLYDRVIRDYPEHPVRAGALFGLGQLQADPAGPLRDYRVAYVTFGRVLAEHPRSHWEGDTRLWRGVLNELLARDDEAQRLRVQLQKLRRIEVDLDKSR